MIEPELHTSFVKWFDEKKGFGFIDRPGSIEGKGDIFVHYSGIIGTGYRALEQNQRVRFRIRANEKGLAAYHVEVLI